MRARRSRAVGGGRGVGGLPASGQARAPAATAMAAIVEQEFQEIDATNDWQARYLVREEAGRQAGSGGVPPPATAAAAAASGGRGEGRDPAAPVAGMRRLSGERKSLGHGLVFRCTQRNCGQAPRMLAGGGRRFSQGGAGEGVVSAQAPRRCACALAGGGGCWRRRAPARARWRPGPLRRLRAAGRGGLNRVGRCESGEGVLRRGFQSERKVIADPYRSGQGLPSPRVRGSAQRFLRLRLSLLTRPLPLPSPAWRRQQACTITAQKVRCLPFSSRNNGIWSLQL